VSLLLLFRTPAAGTGIDVSDVLKSLLPALQAESFNQLDFWTETELYQFADEAAKRLAREVGGFIVRSSFAVVANTAEYSVPARHMATIRVSLAGEALSVSNFEEIDALDEDWPTTAADYCDRVFHPTLETLRLYPIPNTEVSGSVAIVFARYPAEITAAAAIVSAPLCLRDYFTWSVLAAARERESEAAMPEVAQWLGGVVGLYTQMMKGYWGGTQ